MERQEMDKSVEELIKTTEEQTARRQKYQRTIKIAVKQGQTIKTTYVD
jgi:hypothetical protein